MAEQGINGLTEQEILDRIAGIPEIVPDIEDRQAIEWVESRNDNSVAPLEEARYDGRIAIRLPRSLHYALAQKAKEEGISLNQYILYKLGK